MKRLLMIFTGVVVLCSLQAVNAQNVEYVGSYDTPGTAEAVFASGDYAYVADGGSGLLIVDVSDPFNPAPAGSLETYLPARDLYVSDNYAYVLGWDLWGWAIISNLEIVDVFDPASPDSVGGIFTPYPTDIFVSGDYAYSTMGIPELGLSYLFIIDISEPDSPYIANSIWPSCGDNASFNSVFVSGDYAYVDCSGYEFEIWNVSNPYEPYEIGYCLFSGHTSGIFVVGEYAYAATYEHGLRVFDISDPTDPTPVGDYDTSNNLFDLFVSGDYAYVAEGVAGLEMIDISDPVHPAFTASYDTPGYARRVCVQDDLIYVADSSSLMILRFNPLTGIQGSESLPRQSALNQNFPNPFNASTRIDFDIPVEGDIEIAIYDILGRRVTTLFEGRKQPGSYSIDWNAEDVPSGIYFARLRAGSQTESIKMTLLK